jgi:cation:H+ antiporter
MLGIMRRVLVLLIVFAVTGWRLVRSEGAILLAGYAAYIGWLGRSVM